MISFLHCAVLGGFVFMVLAGIAKAVHSAMKDWHDFVEGAVALGIVLAGFAGLGWVVLRMIR